MGRLASKRAQNAQNDQENLIRPSYIPETKRASVVSLRTAARMPFDEIANHCNISASGARKIVKRAIENAEVNGGAPSDLKNLADRPRSGRPVKVTERTKRQLIKTATKSKANRLKTYRQLRDEAGLSSIGVTSVRAALQDAGYGKYAPNQKPYLNQTQMTTRFEWCSERSRWTEEDLRNILWSDETSVVLSNDTSQKVIRTKSEGWHSDCVMPRFKKFAEFMFWGVIGLGIKGPCHVFRPETNEEKAENLTELIKIDTEAKNIFQADWESSTPETHPERYTASGRLRKMKWTPLKRSGNSKGGIDWVVYYTQILNPLLVPFYQSQKAQNPSVVFMQDKAPAHSKGHLITWLEQEGVELLDWPGNSPDLNPIELLWDHMKKLINKKHGGQHTKDALCKIWQTEWDLLEQDIIDGFILRWFKSRDLVIQQKGDNKFHG